MSTYRPDPPGGTQPTDPATAGPAASAALKRPVGWMVAGLVAVAAASVLRAASAGTLRVDQVEIVGGSKAGVALLTTFGLFALSGGFLAGLGALSREQGPRPRWRTLILVASALQCVAALALPLTSNDIFSNLLYGHLEAFRGISAATVSPAAMQADPLWKWVGETWNDTPCVYGPVLTAFQRWVSVVSGGTVPAGVVVTKVAMLCVSLAWVILCAVWARRWDEKLPRQALFWLLACNPIWLSEVAGQAHNDGIPVLLVLLALLAYRRGWMLPCSMLLGVAACAKYFAVAPFGFLMLWSLLRGPGSLSRRVGSVGASVLAFAGVVVACYLPSWEGWNTITYPWSFIATPRYLGSLLQIAYACGAPWGREAMLAVPRAVGLVFALLLGLMTLRWIRRWWTRPTDRWAPWESSFRFVLFYVVLLISFFMPWYLTWLLPLVAVVRDRRWWTVTAVYSSSAVLYYGLSFLLHLGLPPEVSRYLRPLIYQGAVAFVLGRMALGLPPLPSRKD